jgi:hypothetical protein
MIEFYEVITATAHAIQVWHDLIALSSVYVLLMFPSAVDPYSVFWLNFSR